MKKYLFYTLLVLSGISLSLTSFGQANLVWPGYQNRGTITPGNNAYTYGGIDIGPGSYEHFPACAGVEYYFYGCTNPANWDVDYVLFNNASGALLYDFDGTNGCGTWAANGDVTVNNRYTSTITGTIRVIMPEYPRTSNNGSNSYGWYAGVTSGRLGIKAIPPATPGTPTGGGTICTGGSRTLTRTGSPAGSGITWYWQTSATGTSTGIGSGTTLLASPASTTTYYVRPRTCNGYWGTASAGVTVTVVADPTAPTITKNPNVASVCAGATLTIGTSGGSGGTGTCSNQYRYSTNNGSTYTGWSTTVPSFAAVTGTNIIQSRRNCTGSGCNSNVNSVSWTVVADPTAPTITKSPNVASVCVGATLTVSTTGGAGGVGCSNQYRYSTNNGTTYTAWSTTVPSFSAVTGTNIIQSRRDCSGSGCGTAAGNTVSWTVNPLPAATTAAGGGTFCDNTTITASGGAGGTIYFQGTTSNGTSTANASTSENVSASGTYYFRSRSAAGCWGPQGSVTVTINPNPAATTAAGGGTFCDNTTITASGGAGGTIYFQGTTSNGTSTANASTSENVSASGTYYFRSRSAAGCWGPQGSVAVTIDALPTAADAGTDQTSAATCGLTSVSLAANTPGVGTGQWSIVSGTGGSFGNNLSPTSTFNGTAGTAYVLRWTISNGTCTPSTDDVNVTFNTSSTLGTSATVTPTMICAGQSVSLNKTDGTLGSGANWEWYSDPGFSTHVASGVNPSVSPSVTTTYYVRAEGTCGNTGSVSTNTVVVNGSTTAPTSPSLAGASSSSTCVVNDALWHYFYNSSGELLMGINSNGENLGNVTVTVTVGDNGPFGQGNPWGVCNNPASVNGELVMPRYWDISVDNQPITNNSTVRFYYLSGDVTSLVGTVSGMAQPYIDCWGDVTGEGDLMMTVNHSDGSRQAFPSLTFQAGPSAGQRMIEFSLGQFSSGKLHSSNGFQGATVLPVELLSFAAKSVADKYIAIEWMTASESNNEGFELMRSKNGVDFEEIAWIAGNGTTSESQSYSYNDNDVVSGTYYYKLRQIDFDGQSEEFHIVSATIDRDGSTVVGDVRPNPTSSTITFDVHTDADTDAAIKVYSYTGQVVYEHAKSFESGQNIVTIDETAILPNGAYFMTIEVEGEVHTKRFVVNH